MNGFLLFVPFLLIRFGLLSALNKRVVKRAAHFAPMRKDERWVYWMYQISNVALFVCLFFLKIEVDISWLFYTGAVVYLLGLVYCTASIVNFAAPSKDGLNTSGLYRISRNPMYVSYFMIFAGCALLTQSLILGGIVIVFIFSSHEIILAEERWCIERFGEAYRKYMERVRRYL